MKKKRTRTRSTTTRKGADGVRTTSRAPGRVTRIAVNERDARDARAYRVQQALCKAATEMCKGDRLAPGVQVAWIEGTSQWYVALHRYPGTANPLLASAREVVHKCRHDELHIALQTVAHLMLPSDAHQKALAELLGDGT